MSDTPRTDALIQQQAKEWCAAEENERGEVPDRHAVDLSLLARTLERELYKAREERGEALLQLAGVQCYMDEQRIRGGFK